MTHALGELLAAGRLPEASAQATQRLARNPGDGEALLAMARLALLEGRPAHAEQWLTRAVASVPAGEVTMVRAAIAAQRGRWAVARDQYLSLVRQPTHPPGAWYGLGVALLALGDTEGARVAQEQAVKLGPTQASIHFELGRIHQLQGRPRAAARAYVQTLRRDPRDMRAHGALAQLLVERRKVRWARRLLELGLQRIPGAPELQRLLRTLPAASTPASAPGTVSAEEQARHAAAYQRARELVDRKRLRDALKVLREASEQGLRSVPLKLMEAEACAGLAIPDVPAALRAYEEALALDPHGWVVCSNLGLFLQGQGPRHLPRAIEVLEEAHRRAPTRPEPALNLALAYHKGGRRADSLTLARRLEADLPVEHPLYAQARLLVETLGGV